jgi:GNAT superfamily N-acetyltransferase
MKRTEVVRVDPDEWATYRQVRLAALADAPEAFSSTLERERALDERTWRQRLDSADSFLAFRNEEPIGAVTALPYDESLDHGVAGAWQLVAMWVSPRARKLGVGRLLVETVLGHAKASGAPSVVLWVFEHNHGARAFYERLGFLEGDLSSHRPEQSDPEILMLCPL